MINCTFAGHRTIFHTDVEKSIEDVLSALMEEDSDFQFYLGGMGDFDLLCARVLHRFRKTRTEKHIHTTLVEPYMKQSINTEGKWLQTLYDNIIIPAELNNLHYKTAITRRNQWMIDQSQHLIAYVHRDFGGAFAALQYARKRGLAIHPV